MKRLIAVAAVVLMAACGSDSPTTPSGGGNTGPITFTANLSAGNEVPPVTNADANGRGTATMVFAVPRDATGAIIGGGTINFTVQLSGFAPGSSMILAHIHPGAAGINGSPLVNTGLSAASAVTMDANGAGSLTFNNITVSQGDATSIAANPANFYFNVHSQLNAGGAARGQLVKQ